MPFSVSTEGPNASLVISDKFPTPMQPGSFPAGKLKGKESVKIELDANFSNPTAAIQTLHMLGRVAVSSLTVKSALGMAIVLAAAAPVVTIAKGCVIEFSDLPKNADDSTRNAILAKLSARLGESVTTLASWFANGKKLNDAEAMALFAKSDDFKAKAMIGRDGKIDPKKVFARWNASRGKANG